MYAFFMLFAVLAVWAQLSAMRRGRAVDWALYALASVGMVWSQYFALLSVAVQQVAIAVIVLRGWRARAPIAGLVTGWLVATTVIVLAVLPLVPFLSDQLVAYGNRGVGLRAVPPSAGGGAAWRGDMSVYVVGANLVWAVLGYHTEGVMVQIVALWPLVMLGGLLALGRGRSPSTTLIVAFALAPAVALFGVGLVKRDLFELRYFLLVVPVLLLLVAHGLARLPAQRLTSRLAVTGVLVLLLAGLADQQLNTAIPRLYGFEAALEEVSERARPGDVVLYEPWYLEDLVNYYAPELDARAVPDELDAQKLPLQAPGRVFVVGSFLDQPRHAERAGWANGILDYQRDLEGRLQSPNVDVWIYR